LLSKSVSKKGVEMWYSSCTVGAVQRSSNARKGGKFSKNNHTREQATSLERSQSARRGGETIKKNQADKGCIAGASSRRSPQAHHETAPKKGTKETKPQTNHHPTRKNPNQTEHQEARTPTPKPHNPPQTPP
jgi:hypothetical protein